MRLVKLACELPDAAGRSLSLWTCAELARTLRRDGVVDSISPQHVQRVLQSHRLKPRRVHHWLSDKTPRDAVFRETVMDLCDAVAGFARVRPLARREDLDSAASSDGAPPFDCRSTRGQSPRRRALKVSYRTNPRFFPVPHATLCRSTAFGLYNDCASIHRECRRSFFKKDIDHMRHRIFALLAGRGSGCVSERRRNALLRMPLVGSSNRVTKIVSTSERSTVLKRRTRSHGYGTDEGGRRWPRLARRGVLRTATCSS
jgi:hypothetical protein